MGSFGEHGFKITYVLLGAALVMNCVVKYNKAEAR